MGGISGCIVLPRGVVSMTVAKVLDCASALLRAEVPGYRLAGGDAAAIGTWHFNQLIFDLAAHPLPFSGALAQDLLDYMMYRVAWAAATHRRLGQAAASAEDDPAERPNIPKPNVATINGVLKAWMVTPDYAVLTAWSCSADKSLAVDRVEALFDDIEGRYAAGLTNFRAETSFYNALINCWAKSGDKRALRRVT
jgi:hypothetical protein